MKTKSGLFNLRVAALVAAIVMLALSAWLREWSGVCGWAVVTLEAGLAFVK